MGHSIGDQLREVTPGQRTLFHALKRRFSVPLGLTDADLLYLVRRAFIPPHYPADRVILREGDFLDHFTVDAAGVIAVTCNDGQGKSVIVQMVGDGHAFSLPSLAQPWEWRRFGAVAHSKSLIGLVTPDAFRDFIARLDTARRVRMLVYGWSGNIGLLREKRILRALSAKERVWFMLGKLAAQMPAPSGEPGQISIELKQETIGGLAGVTRPTVNRKLKELSASVARRRKVYTVRQPPPFAHPTEFDRPILQTGTPMQNDRAHREALSRLREHLKTIGLPGPSIDAFAQHARLVICPEGALIALPDHKEALSVLIDGAARVECPGAEGKPLPLLYAKPGWLILGGVPGKKRGGFRAVAHVESCAAILTAEGLAHVVATMTASQFLRFVSFGWRVLSHHTYNACQSLIADDSERTYRHLYQLALDFPAAHDDGTMIDLSLTTPDIAALVGINEPRVRFCLAALKQAGRIEVEEGPIRRFVVIGLFRNPRVA